MNAGQRTSGVESHRVGVRASAIAFLAVAAACGAKDRGAGDASSGRAKTRVEVGAPAPDYSALSFAGDSVSLAKLKGSVVLLNVWATWCHPCRAEIPQLRVLDATYRSQGLNVVGVSVDMDGAEDAIGAFVREFQMSFPIWRDPEERVLSRFLVVGVPATFLIDRSGVLRWRRTGPIPANDTSLTHAIELAIAR